jgi:class 3 adenylate cyclase/tetratricopeptide (TPR) repeat protein
MEDAVAALQRTIAALEAQRGLIGAAAVDAALRPLRERLGQLQRPGEQQLRQVSVLFTDVAGSTALASRLDPETVHEVMDGALRLFTQRVQEHGGRVLQYAGDSMLAVFGTPAAREDDAERAVRAGLAVLAEARAQAAAWMARLQGDGFAVRAGIATGPVLLGGGVEGDASIRGAVVNLAARMEQTAPPGALRICPDTRRLVRGLFDLDAQVPLLVKGYVEPIATWLVQRPAAGAAAQATRGVGGVHTPLVGRQDELALLQAAYQARRAHSADAPGVVVVLGDAGLGKSRLAAEFRAWTRTQPEGAYWLQAQASERSAGQPYGLLRQLLARHLGLLDSDSAADARHTWLQAMAPLLAHEGDAAVLGHLLGLDFSAHDEVRPLLAEGRQLRDRAFFHATQALARIAVGAGRLAVFLDDLQWADPGTLEFIEYAQREGVELLMLLCSSRPALDLQRPGWTAQPGRQRIELQPLSGGDAGTLADALLARLQGAPETLRQRLIDGAEGNPFYMEELVNMLIDRGVIVEDGGAWRMGDKPLESTAMPSTLAGVLQARLDELGPEPARAVQLAAVVGPVFWADALRALGLADAAQLQPLVQRQFIVPRPASTLAGQQEFAFRHHLLHQVCYERVLRRVKVPAHAQVAQWLSAQPGERPLDLIAEHHERGHEPELALAAWQRAAESAQARYANEQALAHAQRALVLTAPADLERRFALRYLRVEVLGLRADDSTLEQELQTIEELAERLDDDARRAQAALRRAVHLEHRGDLEGSLRLAEGAWQRTSPRWPKVAARAGRAMSSALGRLGRRGEARSWAETALGLARQIGDISIEGALLNELAGLAADDGDPAAAVVLYEQALQRHREVGHRRHEAGVLSNLGYVDLELGRYARAGERFTEARELARRIGQRALEGTVLINLALAALHGADAATALPHATAARELLAASGNQWMEAVALRVMGQCELALGHAARAAELLAEARGRFEARKLRALALEATASLAQARLAGGDITAAAALVEQILAALDQGASLDGCEEPMRVHLACWQVLQAAGDARAPARLQAAREHLLARAERVANAAQRESYLQAVPHHRALLQAPAA